jgi:hypothetical protein
MLWIFITLKNPLPRPGLNPKTLRPVASMLSHHITEVTSQDVILYLLLGSVLPEFKQCLKNYIFKLWSF